MTPVTQQRLAYGRLLGNTRTQPLRGTLGILNCFLDPFRSTAATSMPFARELAEGYREKLALSVGSDPGLALLSRFEAFPRKRIWACPALSSFGRVACCGGSVLVNTRSLIGRVRRPTE